MDIRRRVAVDEDEIGPPADGNPAPVSHCKRLGRHSGRRAQCLNGRQSRANEELELAVDTRSVRRPGIGSVGPGKDWDPSLVQRGDGGEDRAEIQRTAQIELEVARQVRGRKIGKKRRHMFVREQGFAARHAAQ